jgi:hypothetical protein
MRRLWDAYRFFRLPMGHVPRNGRFRAAVKAAASCAGWKGAYVSGARWFASEER